MSVVENARNQLVSSGSWSVDPVLSTVEFRVEHMMIQTVRGRFRDFDAAIVAGDEPSHFNGDDSRLALAGDLTIKGITRPATLSGLATGPSVDHFGATRLGITAQTTVDRTEFDINWNMPLPNGEPALKNEVTLKADLTLVSQEGQEG